MVNEIIVARFDELPLPLIAIASTTGPSRQMVLEHVPVADVTCFDPAEDFDPYLLPPRRE
jgi:hypothetical protein